MLEWFRNQGFKLAALFIGLWLGFDIVAHLAAEVLWFQAVGYLSAFLLRLQTQLGIWAIAFLFTGIFLLGNLKLANRLKYSHQVIEALLEKPLDKSTVYPLADNRTVTLPSTSRLKRINDIGTESQQGVSLRWLLPLILILGLLLGLMLLYYGQIALSLWQPNYSISLATPALPTPFKSSSIGQLFPQLSREVPQSIGELWQQHPVVILPIVVLVVVVLVGICFALLVNAQFWLSAIAVGLSILFGFVLSANWGRVLQYFHPVAFNSADPLFQQNISFYIFTFPLWQLLDFWLEGLFLYGLLAVTLIYLLSGDSLSQGRFPGFSSPQLRHLYALGGVFMLAIAFRYWLARYQLLYSVRGVSYGASYTDVAVALPVNTTLSILALAIALVLLWATMFSRFVRSGKPHHLSPKKLLSMGLGLFILLAVTGNFVLPTVVQRLIVQPNELVREAPFIQRSIAFTRQAFNLENIDVQTFEPQDQLTLSDLQANDLTVDNIRLWDKRPLLQTNRQLQQIRLYYKFPDADIDRYTLRVDPQPNVTENARQQQVLIAARELNYDSVPQEAQTWVNKHLIYTHGYGFTLSPVNTVGPGGLPEYFVKDIGTETNETGALQTSGSNIRDSIPIGQPRIYYGESTDTYVMTPTKVRELDYPSGQENVYNTYDGTGGVEIGSARWRRLLFAEYLKDWQMLLARNFTPQTKVLFRRNIKERIQAIAPFLQYDRDPYLVVADAYPEREQPNHLYWVVDAYTTSDRYPYSDPGKYGFNYIRNSVKVVVDAYNGIANFYVADPQDPLIRSWSAIFPELFKPLNTMPATLFSHIRYPLDFFNAQSERLLTYHMTDPQVFYNREDQWRIPMEIYGNEPREVEPYFLIMKLPTAETEEFVLLSPFTPSQRNNLIAWLAARSDGQNYGRLLLYQFPKQELIYGPEQIEARINQDPVISQQISLWNRSGSRAIQGNLLVIPIEESLLYVEPVYLEAEQASLPTLVRVIVVYENRIVMAETLEQSLQAIFQPEAIPVPPIVRPIEETISPEE